ncbi:MAG: electron transfer flavoprotein subunit alpha/FixB family protein [Propionibacteriaceae bacterium]|jgi:electron transfer flavoprotein alpha subunit|nr:electron transfer flavoprotein subunit alpha/FixB family protein [Propionibacteriaceae bacterium]
MTATNDLWVFLETHPDGTPKSVGLELLNPGKRLAEPQGGKLVAVVIAAEVSAATEAASRYGADLVITIEGPAYAHYTTEAYASALTYLVRKYQPATMMIGATGNGRDLAPRLSARLQTGLTADCTQLDFDVASGVIAWTRPAFGGNLMATILCAEHRPQMGTVRPGVFKKSEPVGVRAEVIAENFDLDLSAIRTRVVEVTKEVSVEVNLETADIIVTGGRGVGGAAGFALVSRFAASIGGVVGASRAAVEAGWIPHAHQVGQTGKSVSPRVYIACGVSGAIQHVAGMSASDTIIAINKDPQAQIFTIADYGIVGDLFEVLPILEEELRRLGRP